MMVSAAKYQLIVTETEKRLLEAQAAADEAKDAVSCLLITEYVLIHGRHRVAVFVPSSF
jgi:hypothetical protein